MKAVEPTSVSEPVAHAGDSLGEADSEVEGTGVGDGEFGDVIRWLEVVTAARFVLLPHPREGKTAAAATSATTIVARVTINARVMADLFAFEQYCDICRSCQHT